MSNVSGNTGGSDLVVYPLDHMRDTAAKILAQAGDAQAQHDALWKQIQNYVEDDFNTVWGRTVMACLAPYAERLSASYEWQINLATALFDAVDVIEGNENATSQAFVPHRGLQPG